MAENPGAGAAQPPTKQGGGSHTYPRRGKRFARGPGPLRAIRTQCVEAYVRQFTFTGKYFSAGAGRALVGLIIISCRRLLPPSKA